MTIESTLGKYLEFKIFDIFKNRMIKIIETHARENSKEELTKHLFLCPATLSKKRNFILKGVLSPFICMWRTSALTFNKDFYSRSVLYRDFIYTDNEGNKRCEQGFLYDLSFEVELFSASYYKEFRDKVNIDLLDLDRLRYIDIDIKELLKDCSGMNTRIELQLDGLNTTDILGDNDNRSFDLNARYKVNMTIPYCRNFEYLEAVDVYLNDELIFEKQLQ